MRPVRTITRTFTVLSSAALTAAVLVTGAGVAAATPGTAAPVTTAPVTTAPVTTAPATTAPGAPAPPAPGPHPPAPGPRPAGPPAPATTPCAPAAKACFSIGRRTAWLTDGAGHPTFGPVPALGGSSAHPTPIGVFRVAYKDAHHVSNLFHPGQMPNSVFFTSAVAFHQGSLGQTSHGCVHLSRSASQTFFSTLRPGDVVQVVG